MKFLLCTCVVIGLQALVYGQTDNCQNTGCVGGGMCVDYGNNNYRCSCQMGLVGNETHCFADTGGFAGGCHVSGCSDGVCTDQPDGTSICVCDLGYVLATDGKTCVKEVVTCPTKPCQDGTCQPQPGGGNMCVCRDGYENSVTDNTVCIPSTSASVTEDCRNRPCQYGVCIPFNGVHRCQCLQGYKPSAADEYICEPETSGQVSYRNPCDYVQCVNGQCILSMYGSPVCMCYPGFQQSRTQSFTCERIYIPPPPPCTCQNGHCQLGHHGSKICVCNYGYENDKSYPMRCIPIRPPQPQTNQLPKYTWNDMMSVWGLHAILDEMR